MYIGGIDIGSTVAKIAVYDKELNLKETFYESYPVLHVDGYAEIDLNVVYNKILNLLEKACEQYKLSSIAVTSFGETFAMLDEFDNIIAPSMLYTDIRGKEQVDYLIEKLGQEKIALKVGVNPHEMYSLPKMMWIKENFPEEFSKVKRILLVQDFIVYKLTGVAQIDYSLAERSLLFNINTKEYDDELLSVSGIDESLLSKPVSMGTFAGMIKEELCTKHNLNSNIKVLNGCHDQIANMFGSGVFNSNIAMDGAGTLECYCAILNEPPKFEFYQNGYCCVPYLDKYATYAFSYGGCNCIKEFKEKYAKAEADYCKLNSIDFYEYMESQSRGLVNDLFILPYFSGAGTPYMDNEARGSIINLGFEHTIGDLYETLLESLVFELKVNVSLLEKYGVKPEVLMASGGGANSKHWLQLKANILNKKIVVLPNKEIGCAGTALIAGLSENLFESIEDGFNKMSKGSRVICPIIFDKEKYDKKFEKYKKLYKLLKGI